MTAIQRFSRPPARYTEATLVKKLEELGIGRPSTYAPIISTIQRRGYVTKDQRDGVERKYSVLTLKADDVSKVIETEMTGAISGRLHPTDVGKLVNDFLKENFENIMDYNFTADIEKEFDRIANGALDWNAPIKEFFIPFHKKVEHTLEHSARVTGKRVLGIDPKSGKEVCVRLGRFGPMVQIGDVEDEEKPKFAGLRPGQKIETITYEEAMILFQLPRTVGTFEDKDVKVNIGRFGPYILHDSKFTSLKKEYDPYKVSLEEAIILIQEKREADAKKLISEWPEHDIKVMHGRWGPFIKQGKKNVRIPKEQKDTAADLTLETVLKMIEEAPEKGAKTKKAAAKKTTTKKATKKTTTKKSTTKASTAKKSAKKK